MNVYFGKNLKEGVAKWMAACDHCDPEKGGKEPAYKVYEEHRVYGIYYFQVFACCKVCADKSEDFLDLSEEIRERDKFLEAMRRTEKGGSVQGHVDKILRDRKNRIAAAHVEYERGVSKFAIGEEVVVGPNKSHIKVGLRGVVCGIEEHHNDDVFIITYEVLLKGIPEETFELKEKELHLKR
jgi:hypothetical protein